MVCQATRHAVQGKKCLFLQQHNQGKRKEKKKKYCLHSECTANIKHLLGLRLALSCFVWFGGGDGRRGKLNPLLFCNLLASSMNSKQ